MNKVTLTIAKKTYNLNTNEDEQYLLGLAKILNDHIMTLRSKQPSIALVDAAIFTGIDILNEKDKVQQTCDNLRKQVTQYFNEFKKAEFNLENAKNEIAMLKKQIAELKEKTEESDSESNQEMITE